MKTNTTPARRGRPPRQIPDTRTPEQRRADRRAVRRKRAMRIVEEFAVLPDIARVSPAAVEVLLNISSATLWRRVKAKAIQEPARDGRMPYWTAGEIRRLLAGGAK